jgi:AraC-like DNA-binding protein
MGREITGALLQSVFNMLYETAKGNFKVQFKRTGFRDELESIIAIANLNIQRINQNRDQFLWINRHNEVVIISTAMFILDEQLRILDYKFQGDVFEEIKHLEHLEGELFESLLAMDSQDEWRNKIQDLISNEERFLSLVLAFEFHDDLVLKLSTEIIKISHNIDTRFTIYASMLDTQKDEFYNLRMNDSVQTISIWDQELFLKIEADILQHLNEPSRKNYELAVIYGTNEHKIKTGFKKVYGLTPTQYHKKQRIKHCKILIDNTDLPLKAIALKMGFKTYPKFSRYFKSEVKMTPKAYRERGENHPI